MEGGFTLVTLSFSEALYPNRETNYHFDVEKFSFHFNGGSKRFEILFIHVRVSISYYYSISNQHWFRTWLPFYLIPRHESFGFFPRRRKRAREGRKFSLFVRIHESVEGESGQGWPLSRAPPALVRCHWAHATRSLACQAIITVLATARVRAVSLSRRKATDQVNIANRCIVASVNSISRPTDPASLRSLPLSLGVSRLQQIHVFLFSSFFYFAREERSLRFEIVLNRTNLQRIRTSFIDASRFRYENYRGRTNGLCHAF